MLMVMLIGFWISTSGKSRNPGFDSIMNLAKPIKFVRGTPHFGKPPERPKRNLRPTRNPLA